MTSNSTYEHLLKLGHKPEDPMQERESYSTRERGVVYRLEHIDRECASFGIDGKIITEGYRCDKLLLIRCAQDKAGDKWVQIFIELKGSDIEHALKQLESSVSNPIFAHKTNIRRVGRIVTRGSIPGNKSNPKVAKAIEKLSKEYRCSVKILKSKQPDSFAHL